MAATSGCSCRSAGVSGCSEMSPLGVSYQELYEQTKRVLRGTLDERLTQGEPFLLACHECGLAFPMNAEMGMIEQHVEIAHPGLEDLQLDLVWIGEGDPPEPKP